jgi:hypothetical protein
MFEHPALPWNCVIGSHSVDVKLLSKTARPTGNALLTASIGSARNRVPGVIVQSSAVQPEAAVHAVHAGKLVPSPLAFPDETQTAEPCSVAEETQFALPLSAGAASVFPTIATPKTSSRKQETSLASLAASSSVLSDGPDAGSSELRDSPVLRRHFDLPPVGVTDYLFRKDTKRPMGDSAQLRRSGRAGKCGETVFGVDTSPVDDSSMDMNTPNEKRQDYLEVLPSASTVSCAADETSTPVKQKVESLPAISYALQERSGSGIGMGCIPLPPPPPPLPQSGMDWGTDAKNTIVSINRSLTALNGACHLADGLERSAQEATLSPQVKEGLRDGTFKQDSAIRVQSSMRNGVKHSKSNQDCTTSGPSHELTKKCPSCDRMHNGKFGNGKFCGLSCSKTAGAKARWGASAVARKALQQASKSPQAHARRKPAMRKKDGIVVTKLGKRSSVLISRSGSRSKLAERPSARMTCKPLPATSAPTASEQYPSNVGVGTVRDGCGPVGHNLSDPHEIEIAPRPWARDDVNLPPKKKPRANMMVAFSGLNSDTESERSIAVSGQNRSDCKSEGNLGRIMCSPIEQGLVGEDILYLSDEDSWKRGRLVEYRVHDDMHRVQCAGERAAWRWMDLRSIQISFEQRLVVGGGCGV